MKLAHCSFRVAVPSLLIVIAAGAGCSSAGPGEGELVDEVDQGLVEQSITPPVVGPRPPIERLPPIEKLPPIAACVAPPDGTRPDPTLVITDSFVLSEFPLKRVWQQLVDLAGAGASQTALALHQQLWDSLGTSPGLFPDRPHCDDPGSGNGFPLECPRPEASFSAGDTMDSFVPVALFNRFDLAPKDGGHCGEYRIVYAKHPFSTFDRAFIIFEGVLPNPNPACGIESCRPVVDFWEGLAKIDPTSRTGAATLTASLEQLYFTGLPGFEPVVHPHHYGSTGGGGYGGAQAGGQIRLNLFQGISAPNETWQLREHHLLQRCRRKPLDEITPVLPVELPLPVAQTTIASDDLVKRPVPIGDCGLVLQPVTVKNNPFGELFNATSALPGANLFQQVFPAQVAALAGNDPNSISMSTDDTFNPFQSTSLPLSGNHKDDYVAQFFDGNPPNAFAAAIDAELAAINRADLSAADVVARAQTQSCAGCHQLSNGMPLGGGVTWPSSRPSGFVHVDEDGFLSEALWCSFLPFRKKVLDTMASSRPMSCDVARQQPSDITISGRAAAAAN